MSHPQQPGWPNKSTKFYEFLDYRTCCGRNSRAPPFTRIEFTAVSQGNYLKNITEAQRKILKRTVKEALRIQDRFAAEPVLARTGKGYMKSEGVETLQRIKTNLKKSAERRAGKL